MVTFNCHNCGIEVTKPSTAGKSHIHKFCNIKCKAQFQVTQRPITPEELRRMYIDEGLDANAIARIVGRNGKRVWEWLKYDGVPTRPRGHLESIKFKKGQPSAFKGKTGKRGSESPFWKGGITPERQSFYSSQEWAAAALAVWQRDRGICQRCKKDKNEYEEKFHIHHITSFAIKELRSDLDNLILLCATCHMWVHSKKNINKEFIK